MWSRCGLGPLCFKGRDRTVHLIYGFKRGTFWPFVPTGEEQIEPDLTRWLGLFDAPLDD